MKRILVFSSLLLAAGALFAVTRATTPHISGHYLEVRSCDVFTGPCFANAEMGLTGKEGILLWSVSQGAWKNTDLDGLNVIAVVKTDDTLGDVKYHPRDGKAVLIIDARANSVQREALQDLARTMAGRLVHEIVDVKIAPIDAAVGACSKHGCAKVRAGNLVEVSTRCLGDKDHLCGNEDTYYPPLTQTTSATPAFAELAAYWGNGLNTTWESVGQRSAFIGNFSH